MENKISLTEALKKAWKITAKNWLVLVGLATAFFALNFLADFLLSGKESMIAYNYVINPEYSVLIFKNLLTTQLWHKFLMLCLGCIFTYVFYSAILDCLKGIEPQFKFSLKKILYLFFTQIVITVLALFSSFLLVLLISNSLGFLLLGFFFWFIILMYLAIRLQFFPISLINAGLSPIEAFKESWNLTKKYQAKCFLLILLQIALCFAGFIAFGIGILYALPLIYVLQVCFYEQLQNNPEKNWQETEFLS